MENISRHSQIIITFLTNSLSNFMLILSSPFHCTYWKPLKGGYRNFLLAPKASEASWGLSIFSSGSKWLLLCVCVIGYCCLWKRGNCNWVCYRGSSEMSQIHTHWWHFSRLLVTVDFDDGSNTKVWSVDHIIIVIYINGVCYRGSSEMSQIHAQWWHFSSLVSQSLLQKKTISQRNFRR